MYKIIAGQGLMDMKTQEEIINFSMAHLVNLIRNDEDIPEFHRWFELAVQQATINERARNIEIVRRDLSGQDFFDYEQNCYIDLAQYVIDRLLAK